jgi:S1-C subfamily serine protease
MLIKRCENREVGRNNMKAFDHVLAIGNPFGFGQIVTTGLSACLAAVGSASKGTKNSSRPMSRLPAVLGSAHISRRDRRV